MVTSAAMSPGADCPLDGDVDWHEVAAGLWPELKSKQLIMHAALCNYCGPQLQAATSADDATQQEEIFIAQLKSPARPGSTPQLNTIPSTPSPWRPSSQWTIFALALALMVVIAGVVSMCLPSSPQQFSGQKFAEFAVLTHRRSAERSSLDVRSDSEQILNRWFEAKVPFSLALPESPPPIGEERPYRLEGAQLVPMGGKSAIYIAYQMQTGPVGLIVAPSSSAIAAGGIEAKFKNVTFHYLLVGRYKVVTWSLHGNTYALISQEGKSTQRSCMICHSAMRDRDLSQTPTPLRVGPVFQ